MKRIAKHAFLVLLAIWISIAAAPPRARADGCLGGLRSAFAKSHLPFKTLRAGINGWLKRGGRAQAQQVEQILAEQRTKAGNRPWDEHVAEWEKDVTDRMTDKDSKSYPKIDELLALMAAKSPTFRMGLGEFLTQHGAIRFRVLSHFMEDVSTLGKDPWEKGGSVSNGRRFFELWQSRIRLPARRTWTSDDFGLFMTEISDVMFRVTNPEPGFAATWLRALDDVRLDPSNYKVWRNFSQRFLENYRVRYRELMSNVSKDVFGEVRPEIIRRFRLWGIRYTIYQRLASLAVSKKAGDEALYNAEVERLSVELMFFVRPVISGFFLYQTLTNALDVYETNEDRKKFEEDVKLHPEKYLGKHDKADVDRLKDFDEQIDYLTIERNDLQRELGQGGLSLDERTLRQRTLARVQKRIDKLQDLKNSIAGPLHDKGAS